MAMLDVISVEFGDVFPYGVFVVGEVKEARDWERSTAEKFVQQHVEALDPESGEMALLPVWLVMVNDGETGEAVQVQVVTKYQPVLPEPLPGTPFRPVELAGLAVEPYLNRDKCKAPWGGRQHRCGSKLAFKYWARDLVPAGNVPAPVAVAGNGEGSG